MFHSRNRRNSELRTPAPQGNVDGMPDPPNFHLTKHAQYRMDGRRIPAHSVQVVLTYGRRVWTRGAQVFALGQREVERGAHRGLNLLPYEGIQVVCTPEGSILTVYRQHNFKPLRRFS